MECRYHASVICTRCDHCSIYFRRCIEAYECLGKTFHALYLSVNNSMSKVVLVNM